MNQFGGIVVLVPFYRGAVVFTVKTITEYISKLFSSPFIEERLYFEMRVNNNYIRVVFTSPFIEERLYLQALTSQHKNNKFRSRPLLSRSGCIYKH